MIARPSRSSALAAAAISLVAVLAFAIAVPGQDKKAPQPKPAGKVKSKTKQKAVAKKTAAAKKKGGAKKKGEAKKKASPPQPPPPPQDRLLPYRVLVSLATGSDPLVTPLSVTRLRREVGLVLERAIGQTWKIRVEANDWLLPETATGLERLTAEGMRSRYEPAGWDRVMLITLSRTGSRFEVAGRAYNNTTRTLPLTLKRQEYDRRDLADVIATLARDMFQPTVTIDVGSPKGATVTIRAGEFPVADPDSEQLKVDVHLEPFLRYRDRKTKQVVRVQLFPWTYLKVTARGRSEAQCELATALRNPLRGGGRQVDLMAVGIAPVLDRTRVTLLPRLNQSRPLIGHRVVVLPKRLTKKAASTAAPDGGTIEGKEEKKRKAELPPPRRLLSDRNGEVEIIVDPDRPLIWMYVMSGNNVLARVPFVPGRQERETLLLPDDADRLGVEGKVAKLQGDLIETVARRAVYMAIARKLKDDDKPDWPRIDKQLKSIEDLPTLKSFQDELEAIEFVGTSAAQRARNKVSESRIRRICGKTRDLFERHLDPLKLQTFKDEIEDARKSAAGGN